MSAESKKEFRPYGLDPEDPEFLEQLTGRLAADGDIAEFNMSLASQWYEQQLLKRPEDRSHDWRDTECDAD